MEETCRITLGSSHSKERDEIDYYISVGQTNDDLERGERHRSGKFTFSYDYRKRPYLFFLELNGKDTNVVFRFGDGEADRKSFDMFSLFKWNKKELLAGEYLTSGCYKKSLLSDDFECFNGFFPFGFTLIQPSCPQMGDPFSKFFNGYAVHKPVPPEGKLLSFSFRELKFNSVTIYRDLISRESLWRCELRPSRQRNALD